GLAVGGLHSIRRGQQQPITLDHGPLVGVVDRWGLDLLSADVVPDVQLGPVLQREDPHVLTLGDLAVVQTPQLRSLVLRVPLAEVVTVGVDALLGASLLLVPAAAPERGGEPVLLDRM